MTVWDARGSRFWPLVQAELAERGVVAPELAVERYVRLLELADTAWRRLPKKLLAEGSMGQASAHPMVAVVLKAEAEAARYGLALGVEPEKAKKPVGRPKGSASLQDLAPSSKRLRAVSS